MATVYFFLCNVGQRENESKKWTGNDWLSQWVHKSSSIYRIIAIISSLGVHRSSSTYRVIAIISSLGIHRHYLVYQVISVLNWFSWESVKSNNHGVSLVFLNGHFDSMEFGVPGLFGHFKFQVSFPLNNWVGDHLVQEIDRSIVLDKWPQ